jgi:hypothetical protein
MLLPDRNHGTPASRADDTTPLPVAVARFPLGIGTAVTARWALQHHSDTKKKKR